MISNLENWIHDLKFTFFRYRYNLHSYIPPSKSCLLVDYKIQRSKKSEEHMLLTKLYKCFRKMELLIFFLKGYLKMSQQHDLSECMVWGITGRLESRKMSTTHRIHRKPLCKSWLFEGTAYPVKILYPLRIILLQV